MTETVNIKQNYIDKRNELTMFINQVTPLLIARLAEGFKVKNDYSFYTRDSKELRSIIAACKPSGSNIRAYIKESEYSIYLYVDASYRTGEYGCAYINRSIYLGEGTNKPFNRKLVEFEPSRLVELADYLEGLETIEKLKLSMRETQAELSKLQCKWDY